MAPADGCVLCGVRTGCDVMNLDGVVWVGVGGPGGLGRAVASSRGSGRSVDCELALCQAGHRQAANHASYRCQKIIGFIQQL